MPVYKMNSGKWCFKVSYKGKQIYRSGFLSKRDALLEESKFLITVNDSSGNAAKEITLDDDALADLFKKEISKKYKITSAHQYFLVFNKHVKKHFSINKKNKADNLNLINFVKYLSKLKQSDVNKILTLGKSYVTFLGKYDLLEADVNLSILTLPKPKHTENKKMNYFTYDEYKKFRSCIGLTKYVLLFDLLFFYGLRIGELRGLKHTDFDFKNNTVEVKRSITNKANLGKSLVVSTKSIYSVRSYPLLKIIKDDYLSLFGSFNVKKKSFVFEGKRKNENLGETPITVYKNKICDAAGLKRIRIHDFRHSCASYLINNGMDYLQVSSWLGHKNANVTLSTYSHLFPSRKLSIANFIDKETE